MKCIISSIVSGLVQSLFAVEVKYSWLLVMYRLIGKIGVFCDIRSEKKSFEVPDPIPILSEHIL